MAVAGISRPPALFRSPFSDVRTTNRSPVSLIEGLLGVFFVRDRRLAGDFAAGFFDELEVSAMLGECSEPTRYDASTWKPGVCSREP